MANGWYKKSLKKVLDADIDFLADDLKAVLVDTDDYTVDLDTHEFLSDIAEAGRVKTSGNLASKTTTLGTFDCADITLSSVTGDRSEAVVFYKDTGDAATSPLLLYFDTCDGLPITPSGTNITIQVDTDGLFGP